MYSGKGVLNNRLCEISASIWARAPANVDGTMTHTLTPRQYRIQSRECSSSTRSSTWPPIKAHIPSEAANSTTYVHPFLASYAWMNDPRTSEERTNKILPRLTCRKKEISGCRDIASRGPRSSWVTIIGHKYYGSQYHTNWECDTTECTTPRGHASPGTLARETEPGVRQHRQHNSNNTHVH